MKKLTNEEIAKVFAMYLDQPVITDCNGEGIICRIVNIGINSMYSTGKSIDGKTFNSYGIFGAKLLLTPLDKITDEHAIEVAKIIHPKFNSVKVRRDSNSGFSDVSGFICDDNNTGDGTNSRVILFNNLTWESYQYLISKGYAVPLFFGVGHEANGKTAIELGLAIEKQ